MPVSSINSHLTGTEATASFTASSTDKHRGIAIVPVMCLKEVQPLCCQEHYKGVWLLCLSFTLYNV